MKTESKEDRLKFKYNRLDEILEDRGITQTWLANKVGKNRVSISRYCSNIDQPPLYVLYDIADALEISPKELIYEEKQEKEQN